MKVFVTGGSGYLGYSIIEELLKSNKVSGVTCFDNLYRRNSNFFFGEKKSGSEKLNFIEGNILNGYLLADVLSEHEVVIHLAAKVSTPFSDRMIHEFDHVNNWGTAALVSAVEKTTSVRQFVFMSSISVYGNSGGAIVDEDTITSPKSAYGVSKKRAEGHVNRLSPNLRINIIRCGNVYGFNPCIRYDSVVNKFIFDAQYNNKVEVQGSGEQKRAFVHVNNVARAILGVVEDSENFPQMMNLVDGNYSINEVVHNVLRLYPNVDVFQVDQHLTMRSVAAKSTFDLSNHNKSKDLYTRLNEMKNNFRF